MISCPIRLYLVRISPFKQSSPHCFMLPVASSSFFSLLGSPHNFSAFLFFLMMSCSSSPLTQLYFYFNIIQGPMKNVLECLLTLRAHFMPNGNGCALSDSSSPNKSGSDVSISRKLLRQTLGGSHSSRIEVSPQALSSTLSGEDRRKAASDSKFQRALRSPVMAGISRHQSVYVRIASCVFQPIFLYFGI